uniref:Protein kinase domain-containing protein n=1 Tax=Meloidogyne incognita TaxID=6306 RepID=A0A914KM27_MELIC
MKNEEEIGEEVFNKIHVYGFQELDESDTSQHQTRECSCGIKFKVGEVNVLLELKKGVEPTKLIVTKEPIYNGKKGTVKIYHAKWPEENRCVAIKFLIKSNSESKDAANKEIKVLEYFYGSGKNTKIDGPIRIVEYFGHESKTMQNGLAVESIVVELGRMNLLQYYIGITNMKHANVAKQLRRILISAAEALEQFHERKNLLYFKEKFVFLYQTTYNGGQRGCFFRQQVSFPLGP